MILNTIQRGNHAVRPSSAQLPTGGGGVGTRLRALREHSQESDCPPVGLLEFRRTNAAAS